MTFSAESERRITRVVQEYERLPRIGVQRRRYLGAPPGIPIIAIANEDIEHADSGAVNLAKSTAFDGTISEETTTQYTAFNPLFLKVWDGAIVLIESCRLADAGKPQYVITQHWSATRIEATAPMGGITAGSSGTCTSVTPLDGTFSPTTATCYSYTSDVDIGASKKLLAQLYWDTGASSSRWKIYSADCI